MSNTKTKICNYWENRPNIKWVLSALEHHGGIPEDQIETSLIQRDQMHAGTDAATRAFYEWSNLSPGSRILELGSGLGGTARYLARTRGASVCAVELSEHLHEIARRLTAQQRLEEKVSHIKADITRFEHPTDRFDAVWIQHVDMQIEDKAGLYQSSRRNLARAGKILWHDWLKGDREPSWPLFWSADGDLSWPSRREDFEADLTAAGLTPTRFTPIQELTLGWFEKALSALRKHSAGSPLAVEMENAIAGIESGAIIPFFAEATPTPGPDRP